MRTLRLLMALIYFQSTAHAMEPFRVSHIQPRSSQSFLFNQQALSANLCIGFKQLIQRPFTSSQILLTQLEQPTPPTHSDIHLHEIDQNDLTLQAIATQHGPYIALLIGNIDSQRILIRTIDEFKKRLISHPERIELDEIEELFHLTLKETYRYRTTSERIYFNLLMDAVIQKMEDDFKPLTQFLVEHLDEHLRSNPTVRLKAAEVVLYIASLHEYDPSLTQHSLQEHMTYQIGQIQHLLKILILTHPGSPVPRYVLASLFQRHVINASVSIEHIQEEVPKRIQQIQLYANQLAHHYATGFSASKKLRRTLRDAIEMSLNYPTEQLVMVIKSVLNTPEKTNSIRMVHQALKELEDLYRSIAEIWETRTHASIDFENGNVLRMLFLQEGKSYLLARMRQRKDYYGQASFRWDVASLELIESNLRLDLTRDRQIEIDVVTPHFLQVIKQHPVLFPDRWHYSLALTTLEMSRFVRLFPKFISRHQTTLRTAA